MYIITVHMFCYYVFWMRFNKQWMFFCIYIEFVESLIFAYYYYFDNLVDNNFFLKKNVFNLFKKKERISSKSRILHMWMIQFLIYNYSRIWTLEFFLDFHYFKNSLMICSTKLQYIYFHRNKLISFRKSNST